MDISSRLKNGHPRAQTRLVHIPVINILIHLLAAALSGWVGAELLRDHSNLLIKVYATSPGYAFRRDHYAVVILAPVVRPQPAGADGDAVSSIPPRHTRGPLRLGQRCGRRGGPVDFAFRAPLSAASPCDGRAGRNADFHAWRSERG